MNKPTVIAVLSEKGGSGKTNTSINLARYLMTIGKSVVLIDNDPQGSANYWRSKALDPENSPAVVHVNYPITRNEIEVVSNRDFIVIDGSPGLEADDRLHEITIYVKEMARHEDMPEELGTAMLKKLNQLLGPGNQVVARNSAAIRIADYVIIPASVAEQDTMIAEAMIRDLMGANKQDRCMVLLNQARQDNTNNETMYRRRFKAQDMRVLEKTILNRQAYDNCYRMGTTVLDSKSDPKAAEETRAVMEEIYNIISGVK